MKMKNNSSINLVFIEKFDTNKVKSGINLIIS